MNQHEPFRNAKQLYQSNGGDFFPDFDWMLRHGVVISTPETFLMGYFFQRDNPQEPCDFAEADGVFIVLAAGKPKPACRQLIDLVPLLAYERAFRGDSRTRILDIKNYYSKL